MMEQSTEINNNEITKRKKGRPKGTATYTEEEAKERARQRARLHYSLNFEKERERKRMEYHAKKEMSFNTLFFLFICRNGYFDYFNLPLSVSF